MSPRKDWDAKIIEISSRLGIADPSWLDAVINFETGGTYDPLKKNPLSSARGLIQVMDSTARGVFGAADSLTLVNMYPDFAAQMEAVVYPYLKQYAPFPTKQSLYMSIFFPAARKVPETTTFEALYKSIYRDAWEGKYELFKKQNPGILTVSDYVKATDRRVVYNKVLKELPKQAPLLILALAAGALFYLSKNSRKH